MAVGEIKKLDFANGVAVTQPDLSLSGSGSGEINLITNPDGGTDLDQTATDDVGDWIAVGTSVTGAVTETASEIPLSPIATTAIKILVGASGTDPFRVRFRVPDSLYNTKLKISWFQLVGSTYATGDLKLELYNYSDNYSTGETEIALASDSSGDTSIPAASGNFITNFFSDGREYYELRFVRTANGGDATDWISLNNVVVGPGVRGQGAVVGPLYTEDVGGSDFTNGTGLTPNGDAYLQRVGEALHVAFGVGIGGTGSDAANLIWNLPAPFDNITIPVGYYSAGIGRSDNNTAGDRYPIPTYFLSDGTPGQLKFAGSALASAYDGNDFGSTGTLIDQVHITAILPVSEWAGQGTLNVGDNDVEYAATNGTWDAADSSTTYGPGGSAIGGALTSTRDKTVTWQSPIQPSDTIHFQFSNDGVQWSDASTAVINGIVQSSGSYNSGGNKVAGAELRVGTSTTSVVRFRQYATQANDDSPLTDWPSSNAYWRLVKTKAGAAVGFGAATATQAGLLQAESGSFSAAITGPSSTSTTVYYSRVGNTATLTFPDFTDTSTSAVRVDLSLSNMPATLRPAVRQDFAVMRMINSSTPADDGFLRLPTSGDALIFKDLGAGVFAASGTYGWQGFSITYVVSL